VYETYTGLSSGASRLERASGLWRPAAQYVAGLDAKALRVSACEEVGEILDRVVVARNEGLDVVVCDAVVVLHRR